MIKYYQFIHISCNSWWIIIICNYYSVVFKGEMRIALRTLRYIMVHYVRAVSNITTVVFDADDSLHVIMLWFSYDLIVFQYNYHIYAIRLVNYLCLSSLSSRGNTSGACPTRGGWCAWGCTRRWYTEHVKHVKNTQFKVGSWQVADF